MVVSQGFKELVIVIWTHIRVREVMLSQHMVPEQQVVVHAMPEARMFCGFEEGSQYTLNRPNPQSLESL